ncbi:UDP-N-acetylglucosamine transferase subunit ALG13 [Tamaricihabitans halophyticus]|uniref:UDP-N-acetylglucosamine transferase subunit ALG13 n=1 Tax=Tamaricihabitans halophyticus TaxID=1262583 RepID=A0A4R2R1E1_9PSEU|nr:UDP-N-acetylglucosamine transferase subunit ALG13 [Tamaricihabitans halophyticus]
MNADKTGLLGTLGTDHHQFGRLVSWLDNWAAEHAETPVFVQYGESPAPAVASGAAMLPKEELLDRVRVAFAVVTHGGTGSIMEARSCGKLPIVVPRLARAREHVDDHQLVFARKLADTGWIRLAETEAELHEHLRSAWERPAEYRVQPTTQAIEHTKRNIDQLLTDVLYERPGFVRPTRVRQLVRFLRARKQNTSD